MKKGDYGSGVVGRKSGKEFESRRSSERKGWRNSNTYSIKVEEIFVALLFFPYPHYKCFPHYKSQVI